jgi:hypothetical protein
MKESEPELYIRLILIPGANDPPTSPEYQKELAEFYRALKALDVDASARFRTFDALHGGGGGFAGEFLILLTSLPGRLAIELRKLLQTYLKEKTKRRKVKLKYGNFSIECDADNIAAIVSPEQIDKMLSAPRKSKKKQLGVLQGSSKMTAKQEIEFLKISQAYAPDGGPRAASYYVFMVGEKEVAVEVDKSAVMTRDGKDLPVEKAKLAVRTFLGNELKRLGVENLPQNLHLSEDAMDAVLKRLGLPSRF